MMIATPQLTGGAAGRAVLSFFRDRRRARAADGSLPPPPDLSDRVGRPERNWWCGGDRGRGGAMPLDARPLHERSSLALSAKKSLLQSCFFFENVNALFFHALLCFKAPACLYLLVLSYHDANHFLSVPRFHLLCCLVEYISTPLRYRSRDFNFPFDRK